MQGKGDCPPPLHSIPKTNNNAKTKSNNKTKTKTKTKSNNKIKVVYTEDLTLPSAPQISNHLRGTFRSGSLGKEPFCKRSLMHIVHRFVLCSRSRPCMRL